MKEDGINLLKRQIAALDVDIATLTQQELQLVDQLDHVHFRTKSLKSYKEYLQTQLEQSVKRAYH